MVTRPDEQWVIIHQPLRELRSETVDTPDSPWSDRREHFLHRLGLNDPAQYPAIDELITYLDGLPDDQRDEFLRGDELDRTAYSLLQQHSPVAYQEPSSYDEADWADYLATNGPSWDGHEESWQQFRDWFLYHADQRGLGQPATDLITYLETVSGSDRVELFGRYGVMSRPGGGGTDTGGKRSREPIEKKTSGGSSGSGGSGGDREPNRDDEKQGGQGDKPPLQRKSRRIREAEDNLGAPTLTVTSQYTGVPTQILNAVQDIKFHQDAQLTKPNGAPQAVTHYYELRQEVRDTWQKRNEARQAFAPFAQDGPYHPDYGQAQGMIVVSAQAIEFADDPGFSTNVAIDDGEWLLDYEVHFRWVVTRRQDGMTWTSPELHHSMTSPWAGGANVAVAAVAGGNHVWQVGPFV